MIRGHEIEWKNPLGSLVVVVDGKSDPLTEKGRGGQRAFSFKYVPLHFLEALEHLRVMGTHRPRRSEHFVEEFPDLIIGEKVAHWISLAA